MPVSCKRGASDPPGIALRLTRFSVIAYGTGITFLVTVIVCTLCFLGLVMGVRQYLNKHKKSYHKLGASKAERLVEP